MTLTVLEIGLERGRNRNHGRKDRNKQFGADWK